MNITLDKEEDLKDRMLRYAQIVDGRKLEELLAQGLTLQECMDNCLAIDTKMPKMEHRLIIG